jgi:hypothetical protein
VRCALCHDQLEPAASRCPGWGTWLHADCAAGLAGCPTLGCSRAPVASARPEPKAARPRWRVGPGALTALGLLLCLVSPCGTGQLAVARAHLADASRLRNEADPLLAHPVDVTDPRWDDPLPAAELAGAPYLAALGEVRRWDDDAVFVRLGGGIPALVGVVVVARGADTGRYDAPPTSGYTRLRKLDDRVYLYEGFR